MDYAQNFISRPMFGRLGLTGVLSIAGMLGPVIFIAADFATARATPQYNYVVDSISSLAWTRLGFIQTIGFLAIGLLIELFVAGLFFSIRGRRGFNIGLTVLIFFGFGLLMVGAFHTNRVGMETFEGVIHIQVAKIIFWLFPVAVLFVAPTLRRDPYWGSLFWYSIAAAGIAIIMMVSTVWLAEENWFGLFERLLVADEIIWVEIMAIWLLRLSLRNKVQIVLR